MKHKKLVVGITIPGSVGLLGGQLAYFKKEGYDTYLLCPKDKRAVDYCNREGCSVLEVEIEREIALLRDIKSLLAIIKIFRRERPDIVNVGTPKMALLGMLAAFFCGVKNRIYTCRGFRYEHETGAKRRILKFMDGIAARCAHTIICISPSVRAFGVSEGIFDAAKCVVINKGSSNGLDLQRFDPDSVAPQDIRSLQRKWKVVGHFVFGFLGRINDRKGINELYEAFSKLYEDDPSCRLLVVGPYDQTQIKDQKLEQKMLDHPGVVVTGRTDEVPLHLAAMDVFVLPTWGEGFGNVLIQAAAMGKPIISTFSTGTRDAVNHPHNGLLVPVRDIEALAAAMRKLRHEEGLRRKMGINGVDWAKNFESNLIWRGMHELYQAR